MDAVGEWRKNAELAAMRESVLRSRRQTIEPSHFRDGIDEVGRRALVIVATERPVVVQAQIAILQMDGLRRDGIACGVPIWEKHFTGPSIGTVRGLGIRNGQLIGVAEFDDDDLWEAVRTRRFRGASVEAETHEWKSKSPLEWPANVARMVVDTDWRPQWCVDWTLQAVVFSAHGRNPDCLVGVDIPPPSERERIPLELSEEEFERRIAKIEARNVATRFLQSVFGRA